MSRGHEVGESVAEAKPAETAARYGRGCRPAERGWRRGGCAAECDADSGCAMRATALDYRMVSGRFRSRQASSCESRSAAAASAPGAPFCRCLRARSLLPRGAEALSAAESRAQPVLLGSPKGLRSPPAGAAASGRVWLGRPAGGAGGAQAGACLAQGAHTHCKVRLLPQATALRSRLTAAPEWAKLIPLSQPAKHGCCGCVLRGLDICAGLHQPAGQAGGTQRGRAPTLAGRCAGGAAADSSGAGLSRPTATGARPSGGHAPEAMFSLLLLQASCALLPPLFPLSTTPTVHRL
jgi:hypothetical protein